MKIFVTFLFIFIFLGGIRVHATESDQATLCRGPLKTFRAFVTSRSTHAPERGGWELYGYTGDTPDVISCPNYTHLYVEGGVAQLTTYRFETVKECEHALAILKKATRELPRVVVIDKNCIAHIAE